MHTDEIVAELRQELRNINQQRTKIEKAISTISKLDRSLNHRSNEHRSTEHHSTEHRSNGHHRMSAAGRKRLSDMMKKRWASRPNGKGKLPFLEGNVRSITSRSSKPVVIPTNLAKEDAAIVHFVSQCSEGQAHAPGLAKTLAKREKIFKGQSARAVRQRIARLVARGILKAKETKQGGGMPHQIVEVKSAA